MSISSDSFYAEAGTSEGEAPRTMVLNEIIEIARPAQEVFRYVSDFATCEQWDSTAVSAERLTEGAVGVGTRYRVVCALPVGSIALDYVIKEFLADEKVVLQGSCRFFEVEDTITVQANAEGCELEYTAVFSFSGLLGKLAPALESGLQRMGSASVQVGLKQALDDSYEAPKLSRSNARADRFLPSALGRFTRRGYRKGKPGWNPVSAYMVDKHVVITGATAGLGKAAAMDLARMGASLTLVVRDPLKGKELLEEIVRVTGNDRARVEIADLSLIADVAALVKKLRKSGTPIDALINNAGALFNPRQETSEGLEQSYALLLLAPYQLTQGLLPLLKKAQGARVVNVVSGGMYSQKLRPDDLQNASGKYSGSVAYARAKRALMVVTEQWAEEWEKHGIVVNAMHPGWADTPGVESSLPQFHTLTRTILRSAQEGADTMVWLAAATEAGKVSGQLFLDREPRTTHLVRSTREGDSAREELREALASA